MPAVETKHCHNTVEREARKHRLWYHDIELVDGVRTGFEGDYVLNPVLERVDASSR
jgi:hypothetical protein